MGGTPPGKRSRQYLAVTTTGGAALCQAWSAMFERPAALVGAAVDTAGDKSQRSTWSDRGSAAPAPEVGDVADEDGERQRLGSAIDLGARVRQGRPPRSASAVPVGSR